jgi:hypothetical protein
LKFQVGPFTYTLVVADVPIYHTDGDEAEGLAIEYRRQIILSPRVEPQRRQEITLHEIVHCWLFHVPRPRNEEEHCQFVAFVHQQFDKDLEAQGGPQSLAQLIASPVTPIGRPRTESRIGPVSEPQTDRRCCGSCGAEMMVGSVHNGPPQLHEPTRQYRVERWMECEACGILQTWFEFAAPDGTPLGQFVAHPPPRLLRGTDALRFLELWCKSENHENP